MTSSNSGPPQAPTASRAAAQTVVASDCIYVVHLYRSEFGAARLSGRLEHVLSGRRHDFDSGMALLGCLLHEQAHLGPSRDAVPVSTESSAPGRISTTRRKR